ncbi:ORFL81W [Human betaherpesvirus 5]|nr:ORFL81W [Human betaherpesvirus 5]QHX40392.1 ORFL81W [Human betaherpesvirus 5]
MLLGPDEGQLRLAVRLYVGATSGGVLAGQQLAESQQRT